LDLNVYTIVPADQVRVGDYVLGFAGTVLVVDEVRHIRTMTETTGDIAVTLLCFPAMGDHGTRRSTMEFNRPDAKVAILPGGPSAATIWVALLDAVRAFGKAFIDAQVDDVPGSSDIVQAPPVDVDGEDVTVQAAGRTWRLTNGPLPSEHAPNG
jgi:hypothetical protein